MATDAPTSLTINNLVPTAASDWWYPWPASPGYSQPAVTYLITQTPRCAWCQGLHTDKCPDLRSVTYRRDGTVEKVEFFDRGLDS